MACHEVLMERELLLTVEVGVVCAWGSMVDRWMDGVEFISHKSQATIHNAQSITDSRVVAPQLLLTKRPSRFANLLGLKLTERE